MNIRIHRRTPGGLPQLQPFPLDGRTWAQVVEQLSLTPQQARIVELVLRDAGDKHIARQLQLSVNTVQTYLKRIGARPGPRGRNQLIIKVFVAALSVARDKRRH